MKDKKPLVSEILEKGWTKDQSTKYNRRGYQQFSYCLSAACGMARRGAAIRTAMRKLLRPMFHGSIVSYNDSPRRKKTEAVALAVAAEVQSGVRKAVPHGYKMAVRATLKGINAKPTSSALRSLMEKRKGG